MKQVALYTISAILIVGMIYGGFKLRRWVNWNVSYDDEVTERVKELVKPECLK